MIRVSSKRLVLMHSSLGKPWSLSSSIIQELTSQCKISVVGHHFILLDTVIGDTRSRRNFTTLRDVSKMEHHDCTVDWIWPRRRGCLMSPDLPRRDTTRITTRSEILENTKSSLPAYQATCVGHHRRQSWHAIELSVNPTRLNGRDRRWHVHAALVRHSTGACRSRPIDQHQWRGYPVRLLEGGAVSEARVEEGRDQPKDRQHTITVTQNMASCSRRVTIIQRAVRQGSCDATRFSHNAGVSHQGEFTGADKQAQSDVANSNRPVP